MMQREREILAYAPPRPRRRLRILPQHVPILATAGVWILLLAAASLRYDHFLSWQVMMNLLRDNAFLGLTAIGMTFVILSRGIDLSVGATIGLTSILVARLIMLEQWPAAVVLPVAALLGTLLGAAQGGIISYFNLPPFLVTLAGMFLARGLAFVVSLETVAIHSDLYRALEDFSFEIFPITSLIFFAMLGLGLFLAHLTPFGRAVYAIGGSEPSAMLMGLPVGWTKVRIYAFSGFCSALAGIVYTFYMSAGDPNAARMLELDAIAAVVIGGTPLSGGVGYVAGTFLGVLILGIIHTIITFEGTLSTWWARIAIGLLLLSFILLQKIVQSRALRRSSRY